MSARWGRRRTLRGQVSIVAMTVIAGWLMVLALGFDLVIASRLDTQVDDALQVRAQAASATVVVTGGTVTGVRDSTTDGELDSSIWVFAGTRAVSTPDLSRHDLEAAQGLAEAAPGFHDAGGERFYVLPVSAGGRRIGSVIAAIDRDPYEHTRDIVVIGSVVIVLLGAIGAYPVLAFATGRALRPVARMTAQAHEWSVNSPNQRFGAGQQHAELVSLAGTLDELLERLAAVLRHERQLSAELSHELRTPLTRISGEVELMAREAPERLQPGLAAIAQDCRAMDSIMTTLLAAARSELSGTVGRCVLSTVFAELAALDGRITVIPTALAVGVDAELVTRMLAPVVDNARRYARARIEVSALRASGRVVIEVANDGPVLSGELTEAVFRPGFQADPQSPDDPARIGAGLGLALARRLARSADGDLVAVPTSERTTFRLTLPAG